MMKLLYRMEIVRVFMLIHIILYMPLISYPQCNILWESNYGGSESDVLSNMITTESNGYLISGFSSSNSDDVSNNYGDSDIWLVEIDDQGLIVWEKNYGGSDSDISNPNCLLEFSDGGYIFSGTSTSSDGDITTSGGFAYHWLVKIDNQGQIEWEKTYNAEFDFDNNFSLINSSNDSGFLICGYKNYSIGNNDYQIIRINELGSILWEKSYGGSEDDKLQTAITKSNGGYLLGGYSTSNDGDISENYGNEDIWLVNLDIDGNIIWEQNYGGSGQEMIRKIIEVDDGYILIGTTNSNDFDVTNNFGEHDIWVVKIGFDGNIILENNFGGSAYDSGADLMTTQNGFILVCNSYSSNQDFDKNFGLSDGWLVNVNNSIEIIWKQNFGGVGTDAFNTILQDNNGDFIIGGVSDLASNDVSNNYGLYDYWVLKLDGDCLEQEEDCVGVSEDIDPFITTWKTDEGLTNHSSIIIPFISDNFDVDWDNDGIYDECGLSVGINTGIYQIEHDFGEPGTYKIRIRANNGTMDFSAYEEENKKLISVDKWGDMKWTSLQGSFFKCINLSILATDTIDLSLATDMTGAFQGSGISGGVSHWDVSNITSLNSTFKNATNFDDDLSNWDVSSVIDMGQLFLQSSFNGDIGDWKVSNVENMAYTFWGAKTFNQDISNWATSNVKDMSYMFYLATNFNQDLGDWDLSSVDSNLDYSLFNMLDSTNLSTQNYEATLNGWAANPNTPDSLILGAAGLQYCDESGRTILDIDMGWTINGDQPGECAIDNVLCEEWVYNLLFFDPWVCIDCSTVGGNGQSYQDFYYKSETGNYGLLTYDCVSYDAAVFDTNGNFLEFCPGVIGTSGQISFNCSDIFVGNLINGELLYNSCSDVAPTDCFECPDTMQNAGDSCDDGDDTTSNDVIQADCSCAGESDDCIHPDYNALMELYNSTNGDNWTNNDGWDQSCDPCDGTWYGIECNQNRVVCIDLEGDFDCQKDADLVGNNLTGTYPLLNLPELVDLYLGTNDITGNIDSFGNIPKVQNLSISSNKFTGRLPALSDYTELRYLWVNHNQFDDEIPDISSLIELRSIDFNDNNFEGKLPNISTLVNLSYFNADKNDLSDTVPDLSFNNNELLFSARFNNLTGSIPEVSGNHLYLGLYDNDLSGCYPQSICQLIEGDFGGFPRYEFGNNLKLPDFGDPLAFCNGESEIGKPCDDGDDSNGTNDVILEDCTCGPGCTSTIEQVADLSICMGESIEINGNIYDSSGMIEETFQSVGGCDSTIMFNLEVLPASFFEWPQIEYCTGQTVVIGGEMFTSDNSGQINLAGEGFNGCDSIINYDIVFSPSLEENITVEICEGEEYAFNGQFISDSGEYFELFQNAEGCDSIITLSLNVLEQSITEEPEIIVCKGEMINIEGVIFDESYTYHEFLYQDQNGCDSIHIVQVEIDLDDENCLDEHIITPTNSITFSDLTDAVSEIVIFNRWGSEVYKITDPASEEIWDGRTNSGNMLPEGTYYYLIISDGNYTNDQYTGMKQGFITLLN